MRHRSRVVGAEPSKEISFEGVDVPEWSTVSASIGKQVDGTTMSAPDHLVRDSVEISTHRCHVILYSVVGVDSPLEAFPDLRRVQSMIDEVLKKGSFVPLLIGLVQSEVRIVLL